MVLNYNGQNMVNKKCQIFTPTKYVKKMLNLINYNTNLFGKSFLENSCGDGAILVEAVKLYIKDCVINKFSIDKIKRGLEKDFEAFDIDPLKIQQCIINLNKTCAKYGMKNIQWNIKKTDALKYKYRRKYDYIIGNPPYISYKDLDAETRLYLKNNYNSCAKGRFDYCYAFIESAINNLKSNGKMSFLIPNSIFKNVFGNEIRETIKPSIIEIFDNFPKQVFRKANVSPSIIVINKKNKQDFIEYYNMTTRSKIKINKNKLKEKWFFSNRINNKTINANMEFSSRFIISNSIATLSNESFLIKDYVDYNDIYIKAGKHLIEKELLKNAVSPSSLSKNKTYKIIFPYCYLNGKLKRYNEKDFKALFPKGYKYLKTKRKKLDNRNSDDGIEWYEYGRSQALRNMDKAKLMISIMFTNKIKIFELNKDTIPFSGIYIVPKTNDYNLEEAKDVLLSESFKKYCDIVGIKSSGKSKRLSCNDIKKYIIGGKYGKIKISN